MGKKNLIKICFFIIFILVSFFVFWIFYIKKFSFLQIQTPTSQLQKTVLPENSNSSNTSTITTSLSLPTPFTTQAPTGNWDKYHNETCEEAVMLMAAAHFNQLYDRLSSPEFVETEFIKLTNWQTQNFGYHLDTTTEEIAYVLNNYFSLQTEILDLTENSQAKLKEILNKKKLLALSTDGRLLNNPNYKRPGPIHHMLLITGYDKNGNFFTNDPGTKKGKNYIYDFETLYKAAGNWNHENKNTDTGQKKVIVIYK